VALRNERRRRTPHRCSQGHKEKRAADPRARSKSPGRPPRPAKRRSAPAPPSRRARTFPATADALEGARRRSPRSRRGDVTRRPESVVDVLFERGAIEDSRRVTPSLRPRRSGLQPRARLASRTSVAVKGGRHRTIGIPVAAWRRSSGRRRRPREVTPRSSTPRRSGAAGTSPGT